MKVLLVEDEADLRASLEQSLREHGYAVDAVGDGEDACYYAAEEDYDAVLLDVMLPGCDGWTVLERLRTQKKTPVLVLTARGALADRIHGLDLGADDYVVKPFDLAEVHARLRAIIRRAHGEATTVLGLGRVTLDLRQRVISLDGTPVELTAREFALVEYLGLRRGAVVSRTELYDHLFAETDDSFSNLLDVHVCNVRKKLGKDFIETRRGQGYMLAGGAP